MAVAVVMHAMLTIVTLLAMMMQMPMRPMMPVPCVLLTQQVAMLLLVSPAYHTLLEARPAPTVLPAAGSGLLQTVPPSSPPLTTS
jgi:hypothetical protein